MRGNKKARKLNVSSLFLIKCKTKLSFAGGIRDFIFSLLLHLKLIGEVGYLLFGGQTRQMTQYAATAVAGIDPDGARFLLGYFL